MIDTALWVAQEVGLHTDVLDSFSVVGSRRQRLVGGDTEGQASVWPWGRAVSEVGTEPRWLLNSGMSQSPWV